MLPLTSTATVMFSGFVCVGMFTAFGNCIGTVVVITGMVIRKMMRSTSITSTSGVVLISDIMFCSSPGGAKGSEFIAISSHLSNAAPDGAAFVHLRSKHLLADGCGGSGSGRAGSAALVLTNARAAQQIGVQVAREVPDLVLQHLVTTDQPVVAEHRGHGDDQADGGHVQRLTDGAGDLGDVGLAGDADVDERPEDAHDGAEQSDERGGRADRGEERETGLEAAVHLSDRALQGHGDPLVEVDAVGQAAVVMRCRAKAVFRDETEVIALRQALEIGR